jgi:excisionase family DNA binding protein
MEQTERLVYTMKEVQEILRVSKNHVYLMAKTGAIPTLRLGKKIVVPRRRLEQLLEGGWEPPKGAK